MNLPDAPIAHEGFFATHFFHCLKDSLEWAPSLPLAERVGVRSHTRGWIYWEP